MIAGAAFFFSQIAIPLWRGTALFPMFRREMSLESKLESKRQEDLEYGIEKEINKKK
jgi:hypothetical protein